MSKRKPKAAAKQSANSIEEVQQLLRRRVYGHDLLTEIIGLEQERGVLLDLVKRTATLGESNSVLIIGPRGAGKSMVLSSVLEEINQQKDVKENCMQVTLNGYLQTDDRIALKEITRQLYLENTVGDKVFGSFAENLQFLLQALKSGGQQSKPIIFILDEFDLFAHHRNQTLLYNLFDIAQSAQAPICVIGLTCRLDVIELLEKRVKSRFSHRQIYIFNKLTFEEYLRVFKLSLCLPVDFGDLKFVQTWNKNVESLVKEASLLDVLKRLFETNKDIRTLKSLMTVPVCRLSSSHPNLEASDFIDSCRLLTQDSKSNILLGISILELCLIIAMKHLMEIYDGEPFNFEMLYNEYRKYAERRSSMQMFDRQVVMKAFEHLVALELVRPLDGVGSKTQKEYRLMSLLVEPAQLSEALQRYPGCPTEIKQWAQTAVLG
ncbi:origin recognition complex subunit 4 isoform X1 [Lingula anatina]|uniref:Origin recognition complex subunit 4 n=1 Tax=Lingula anatina TaxID=7574 RepID=A0A1S3GYH9_LINAN|nr:origin recognition complex subunit 4 isoform X1 [Lingula anatina]|eukprot:XP_013378930.1 origin recognition complex subunit 4 isoform X1 [Lingula anatina]